MECIKQNFQIKVDTHGWEERETCFKYWRAEPLPMFQGKIKRKCPN